MARVWANETENTPLTVNSVNPGATRTHMRAQAMPGEDPETLPEPAQVARAIIAQCGADTTHNGAIFDVRAERWIRYQPPA
jgi:NAD(P)-dependent dehydrogenase (short-subunit alcohol dehydrogenase family)